MTEQQPSGDQIPGIDPIVDPPAFDWNSPLPDNVPDAIASLKGHSFQSLVDANVALRRKLGEQGTKIKELEGKALKDHYSKPETPKAKQEPNAPAADTGDDSPESISIVSEGMQKLVSHYYEHGSVPEEALHKVAKEHRIPARDLLDVLEHKKSRRDAMIQKIEETHPDVKMTELERWMNSPQSTFSPEAVIGFVEMANRGNIAWVDLVNQEYQDYLKKGGRRFDGSFSSGPPVSGRPAGADAETAEIADSEAFIAKLAKMTDQREINELIAKRQAYMARQR